MLENTSQGAHQTLALSGAQPVHLDTRSTLEVRRERAVRRGVAHPGAHSEPVMEVIMQPRPGQASFRGGLGCFQGLVLETPR